MENIKIIKITKVDGKLGRRPLKEEQKKKDYVISPELRKKYNDAFTLKHKLDRFECEVCLTSHSIFNKSYHYRSKKHNLAINLRKTLEAKPHTVSAAPILD